MYVPLVYLFTLRSVLLHSHCIKLRSPVDPNQKGLSASGNRIPTSSFFSSKIAPFSSNAMISLGIAAAVPLSVCANVFVVVERVEAAEPEGLECRIKSRRAW